MSYTLQNIQSRTEPSTVFSRLHDAQKAPVSHQARNLLTSIILWSGHNGFCWWGIPAIAREFAVSEKTVRRWKHELIHAGLLREAPRPGRSSILTPFPEQAPGPSRGGVPSHTVGGVKEKEIQEKNVCTLPENTNHPEPERKNVVEVRQDSKPEESIQEPILEQSMSAEPESIEESETAPPVSEEPEAVRVSRPKPVSRPFDMELVHDIESVTKDYHSRGAWISVVRELDEQTIRTALSATQCARLEQSGVNAGAYFIGTLRNMSGFTFKEPRSRGTVAPPRSERDLSEALRSLELRFPEILVSEMFKTWLRNTNQAPTIERLRLLERTIERNYDEIVRTKPEYVRERAA